MGKKVTAEQEKAIKDIASRFPGADKMTVSIAKIALLAHGMMILKSNDDDSESFRVDLGSSVSMAMVKWAGILCGVSLDMNDDEINGFAKEMTEIFVCAVKEARDNSDKITSMAAQAVAEFAVKLDDPEFNATVMARSEA